MPHYKDGTPAKIGDRVKGAGYNAERMGYDPQQGIVGIVVEVRPNNSPGGPNFKGACTLSVAHLRIVNADNADTRKLGPFGAVYVTPDVEYGDTVCFEKID